MDEPTLPRLEPMTFGMVLDRMFRLYVGNFALLLGIAALVYVPVYGLWLVMLMHVTAPVVGPDGRVYDLAGFFGASGFLILCYMLAVPLATAAGVVAISERFLGNRISVWQAYGRAWRRLWKVLGAEWTVGALVLLAVFVPLAPAIASIPLGNIAVTAALAVAGMIAGIVLTVYLWTNYLVVVPCVVIENIRVFQGLQRSRHLSFGFRWKILGLLVILMLIGSAVGAAPATISLLVMFTTQDLRLYQLVNTTGNAICELFLGPLQIVLTVLIYYDLRIRKEGFDLDMLSQALGSAPAPQAVWTPYGRGGGQAEPAAPWFTHPPQAEPVDPPPQ